MGIQSVAVAAALVWAVVALTGGESVEPAGPVASAAPIASAAPSPEVLDTRQPGDPSLEPLGSKNSTLVRPAVTMAGIRLSYRLPQTKYGWTDYGSNYISQDAVNSQEAEAVLYWTTVPGGGWADPCAAVLDLPPGTSTVEITAAISSAPGTELVSGPTPVTVGGRAAEQVVLAVSQGVGCNPGYFYSWKFVLGGPFWEETSVGDTIRVWVVAVGRKNLLIVGETTWDAGPLNEEILQIVDSIRFPQDPPDWVGSQCAGCR